MIHSLRQRHRRIFYLLAPALPLLLIWAVSARRDKPPARETVSPQAEIAAAFPGELLSKTGLWEKSRRHTRLLASAERPAQLALELSGGKPLTDPDLLVYWSKRQPDGGLPGEAFLIGSLKSVASTVFLLPAEACRADGFVLLYSLAHQQVIGHISLPGYSLLQAGDKE